jgi:hypothetical protein
MADRFWMTTERANELKYGDRVIWKNREGTVWHPPTRDGKVTIWLANHRELEVVKVDEVTLVETRPSMDDSYSVGTQKSRGPYHPYTHIPVP